MAMKMKKYAKWGKLSTYFCALKQIMNEVSPPGCSVYTSITNRNDGSTEKKETLSYSIVTVEKASGKTNQRPAGRSKLGQKNQKLVRQFMNSRATESSSSNQ